MTFAIVVGGFFALLAVGLGAFGAHALKNKFAEARYAETWETAVRYQMYHALALILFGIVGAVFEQTSLMTWAAYLVIAGVGIFSGSLYILSLTGIRKLGAITPIGGVFFIAGWLCFILNFI